MTPPISDIPKARARLPFGADVAPPMRFDHLRAMTGPFGLFEHALLRRPRVSHGYTTDDNARALVVLVGADRQDMVAPYLNFVRAARTRSGFHNRLSPRGVWLDRIGSDDCVGRAIWGLAMVSDDDATVEMVLSSARTFTSPHPRAVAYAVIGLSHLVVNHPRGNPAASDLTRLVSQLPSPASGPWRWPYARMTYDNARIPQSLIEAGRALGRSTLVDDGLELLSWLLEAETRRGRISLTPHRGRGPTDSLPGFDQQPLEAWAMSDACIAAASVDGPRWLEGVNRSLVWLMGDNDSMTRLYDPSTGATHDGLTADGVNANCGAESTLAGLGVLSNWRESLGDLGHSVDDRVD